jgi:hypothetical protein
MKEIAVLPNWVVKLTPKAALLIPITRFTSCGASLPRALGITISGKAPYENETNYIIVDTP